MRSSQHRARDHFVCTAAGTARDVREKAEAKPPTEKHREVGLLLVVPYATAGSKTPQRRTYVPSADTTISTQRSESPMHELALFAGSVAAAIFMLSQLPMLAKACRTRDLTSYSFANIGLANLGNLLYAVYVFHVPLGPVWAIHGFNSTTSGLMLFWYLRHGRSTQVTARSPALSEAPVLAGSTTHPASRHGTSAPADTSPLPSPSVDATTPR
jgi:hypothetical protein